MNAYRALSGGQGKLLVRLYLSARDKSELEVRVSESSLMALLTSMMHIEESIRNIRRTITKVEIDMTERRPFRLRHYQHSLSTYN